MKIKRIIPFAVLKKPLFVPIYLNIIPIIIGIYVFFKSFKVHKYFLLLIIIYLINIPIEIYYNNLFGLAKLLQLLFLLFFTSYLIKLTNKDFLFISKLIIIISIFIFIIEIFFIGPKLGYRMFFIVKLPRYVGPIGEFNFSGLLLSGIALIFLINRKYFLVMISIFTILLTASRAAFIPIILFVTLNLFYKFIFKNKRIITILIYFLFIVIILYPLDIYILHHNLDLKLQEDIAIFSSMRYVYHVYYVKMGLSHIFGIGYFNGINYLKHLMQHNEFFIFSYLPVLEQHNLFIQVLSEFGLIGYIIFMYFFFLILKKALKKSIKLAILWISILFNFLFLNGLSEFILYFIIAYILKKDSYYEKSISS